MGLGTMNSGSPTCRSINEKKVVAGWLDKISDSEERRIALSFLASYMNDCREALT